MEPSPGTAFSGQAHDDAEVYQQGRSPVWVVMRCGGRESGKFHCPVQGGLNGELLTRGFIFPLLVWLVKGFCQGLREQLPQVDVAPCLDYPEQAGWDWWQARVVEGMQLGLLPLVPLLRDGRWCGC